MSLNEGDIPPPEVPHANGHVARTTVDLIKALALPDVKERLAALGADVVGTTPEETAVIFKTDLARFTKVAHAANIHAD